jgi:hypothetical protein
MIPGEFSINTLQFSTDSGDVLYHPTFRAVVLKVVATAAHFSRLRGTPTLNQ